MIQKHQILQAIESLPRISLARLCTPLEEASRFRETLAETCPQGIRSVPRIFIKRDDATGFAFGGNKARHMEFSFGRFLQRGIDTIVNVNHYHSNQARFVAASSARLGIKVHLVSVDMTDAPVMGNLLIGKLLGAQIHRVPSEYSQEVAQRIVKDETDQGRSTIIYSQDEDTDIDGMIAFLETGIELQAQLQDAHLGQAPIKMWGLVGRSIAGLRLFAKNSGIQWHATAVAYSPTDHDSYAEHYQNRSQRVAQKLSLPHALDPDDLTTLTEYVGEGYGIPHDGVLEAIHLLAATESVILDPNYTGKAMAALIAEARADRLDPEVPIVFIHSGGLPQTFAFSDQLWQWDSQ